MKKIILSDFFTTLGAKSFFTSLAFLTFKLPSLRRGKSAEKLEKKLLEYLNAKDSKILSFYN
ncbi:MAG: hypothetical protein LBF15_01055 [Candidatus Peribacteria bacterium]|jgi:FPC/CPF motif-containing protein YcgG|nr:hypothetical protein [Candidatus Peribacteria bacterium]